MESYSVQAVLSVTDKNFTQTMNRAVDTMGNLDSASQKTTSSIMDIVKGIGAFKALSIAADAVKDSLGGAIERFDALNQYPKVMKNLGYSTNDANESLSRLSDGIQGLPTALDDAATYTKQWALVTKDLEMATDLYLAINDGAIAYGASAEQAASCQEQLNQMISTGTYDLQSWKIIQQNCPGMLDSVAQAILGESAAAGDLRAALNEGAVTTEQFENTLISLDQNGTESVTAFSVAAQTASGGIATSATNMQTAVVRGMENLIRSTNDALENNGLPGFQGMIEEATSGINKAFSVASSGAELLVNNLDVLVPVLGTATTGFLAYKTAMDIGNKYAETKKAAAEAASTLKAVADASKLAEAATKARANADKAAELADKLCQKSAAASAKAIKSKAAAEKLSEAAAREKTNIDKKGVEITGLKAAAEKMEASAAKAQANANKDAARASTLKKAAEEAETRATALGTAAEASNAVAETAGARATTVSSAAVAAKVGLLGVLSGEYTIVEAGQLAWNAAMEANPAGMVIVVITALIAVLVGVSKALERLDTEAAEAKKRREDAINSSKDLQESLESTKKAYDENVSSIEKEASANEKLTGKIEKLAAKENKSAKEKAELQSYVDILNGSMSDLNLEYDAENDALSMSADLIKAKVAAYKEQAEAQTAQERYTEVLKEQMEVEEQLAFVGSERNELEKEYQNLSQLGPKALGEYNKATAELTEQEDALNGKKKELAASEEYLTGVMEQCQTEQTEAVKSAQEQQQAALAESIANQTVSLEQLSEANQATVNTLSEVWQDYTDKATDMFDTLSNEQTMSVEEMISNIQKNQEVISQWGDNMESLRDRFTNLNLSRGVLEDLADMGPEGAGYVAALVGASDEQLQTLAQSFDNGGTVAKESLLESLGVNNDEIPTAIQNMFTQVEASLNETIEGTDWSSLGETGIDGGVASGIESGSGGVSDAAVKMATDSREAAGASQGEGSPCTSWIELGNNMVAGLAQGLMDSGMAAEAAVQMADNVVQAVQEAMEGADFSGAWNQTFSGMSSVASSNMSKVTSAVKSGMSASVSEVSTGASSMQRTMNTGMTGMSAVVKSKMAEIDRLGETGMNQYVRSISSGMARSERVVSNGVGAMISAVSSMQPRFYNAGYYSAIGLANGINAGSGAAIAAANRIASQVSATMEAALKIGSPSRVTRKIGGYTTEGFVIGLLDDIRTVKETAIRLGRTAMPDYGSIGHASYSGGYAPGRGYDLQEGCGSTYTIIVPLELEGREVARALATYTQEELDDREKFENYRKGYR